MDRRTKKNDNFTVMIVPNAHSSVQTFKVPLRLIYGLAAFGFISIIVISHLFLSYGSYQITKIENEELKTINSTQSVELKDLERVTTEVLTRIEAIAETDAKVRELVGLKEKEDHTITSRSQGGGTLSDRSMSILSINNDYSSLSHAGNIQSTWSVLTNQEEVSSIPSSSSSDKNQGIESTSEIIKSNLDKIINLLDEQEETLDSLEDEVIERLEYLDAIPSGWPLRGRITSGFGWRRSPFNKSNMEYHAGIDIAGSYGTSVLAAGGGRVTFVGWKGAYGNTVVINHGYGYVSQYAHNSSITVRVGEHVKRGHIIARVGSTGRSTGPHVDYRVSKNGNWIDPRQLLD